ncbi:methionyl-tRNA formyltransferase [Propionimicrobium lymphophilum]|uniref:Methionyl-tRNA formyltransferase n=1 Tax=Propionimicrobium lymphophilum ACS-093-V-SCH5 TaxID=883161 RepID=S2WJM3_9ACTN|nr:MULTISPECIES: methionyl-tRNA formyltransferase [Propionimicrobium]EPD32842.1 methionyl-tRNA formyltransferase [Propionimicrobium lymphophilum ACS-093-V-SCH5]ETJ98136.1 methionyl-tRNA formyltransferase [Propionimicrobium sp. BV2F7]MDK7710247.1 methionyl-tRNA formyltransferase [Propionimicrobium lymphophilum]MDK7734263.1 methionyl-tRNA formyltransferase [Propionimicrobium lymphophilum]
MRIVFAGTPSVAVPSLAALAKAGHEIAAVVTRPDATTGRGKKLTASPVAEMAEEMGVDVIKIDRSSPEFVEKLRALKPDVCPVVAFGALLPQEVLDIPKYGWINLHFSKLPAWRGAAPVQRALMAGETEIGATTFRLVKQLDAGPVYRQISHHVGPLDVAGDVLKALSISGASLMVRTIDEIAAGKEPKPQPPGETSYAKKISSSEVRIDWKRPAAEICNIVRGASPAPGAWCQLNGARFKILLASPDEAPVQLEPGQMFADRKHLWVGAKDGELELLKVQAAGKKPMSGADWARGIPKDELENVRLV